MPHVLWGVGCFQLPGPMTPDEIVHKFREAMSLDRYNSCSSQASPRVDKGGASEHEIGEGLPHVELYRLVRIGAAEDAGCRLSAEDRIVVHLPGSTFSCAEIEELHRLRDDAELRLERMGEALETMMSAAATPGSDASGRRSHPATPPPRSSNHHHESDSLTTSGQPAAVVGAAPQGAPASPYSPGSAGLVGPSPAENGARSVLASQATQHQMCHFLRQENKVLRYKLDQSEVIRQETQETVEMLRKEFMLLVHELMPQGQTVTSGIGVAPAASGTRAGSVGSTAIPGSGTKELF